MIKKFRKINWLFIISLLVINSCQTTQDTESKINAVDILHSTTSVTFSANRLWRLIPSNQGVYVDYSDDYGKTYSPPVRVNKQDQQISAWPENPPAIEVSQSGRIYVLFYADEQQKSTSYLSYSDDNGQTFSVPSLISNHAKTAMHYMDKMLIDPNDQLYLFWHDTRHNSHDKKQMEGVLSLYYSTQSVAKNSQFNNNYLSSGVCSCCRTATTFSSDGKPVIMARMVFDDGIRDHALIRMQDQNSWLPPQRVTFDNWSVEACPEHGPAIAIDETNRTHLTWFTLGELRQGIYYSHTDDFGTTTSEPISLGNKDQLPSHPDVITLDQRVVVVWKEFDGEQTSLQAKESFDRGATWISKLTGLNSKSKNSHPSLLTNGINIFLSWTTENEGHQIVKL